MRIQTLQLATRSTTDFLKRVFNTIMAKVRDLPIISAFSLGETSTISQRWRKWVKSVEYYIATSGIPDKKQQRAINLSPPCRTQVQDIIIIFETLEDTGNALETAVTKLTDYTSSRTSTSHLSGTIFGKQAGYKEKYAICLKHEVKFYDYDYYDDMIRDQIIEQYLLTRLRWRLLREPYP